MAETVVHAVVNTDNMSGSYDGSQIVSVRYMGANGETPAEIDNGHVVKLGGLVKGQKQIFIGKDVEGTEGIDDIYLIASPEIMYDERKRNLSDFTNEEGANCAALRLVHGGIFSVTAEALTGSNKPVVGNVIHLVAGTKLGFAATATGTQVGKVIDIVKMGRYTYYTIQID